MKCFIGDSIESKLIAEAISSRKVWVKNEKEFRFLDESGGSGTAINQTGGIGSSSIGGHGGADSLLNASPGAYSSPSDPTLPLSAPLERMSTDIHALKKQYSKLQQRMQQVHVIYYGNLSPTFCCIFSRRRFSREESTIVIAFRQCFFYLKKIFDTPEVTKIVLP